MRIFKTKWFDKWASKEGLTNAVLIAAVDEIAMGLVEASLGGNVYKKRIRLPGRGKSSGARTILAYRVKDKSFFVYGYSKNERDNIDEQELSALKLLAAKLLALNEESLQKALERKELKEVMKNG